MQIKKLHPAAKLPTYARPGDAGMDLYASEPASLEPGQRVLVGTGLAMAVPDGQVGLIWDKSGVATKTGITTLAGVVDAGYRGEVKVLLFNTSNTPRSFAAGDKIAQMVIQPVVKPALEEVTELDQTARGEGGFGSTGAR